MFQHEKFTFHCACLLVIQTRLHSSCCLTLFLPLKEAGDGKATIICCISLSYLLPAHFLQPALLVIIATIVQHYCPVGTADLDWSLLNVLQKMSPSLKHQSAY